jgi:hypothetical protein
MLHPITVHPRKSRVPVLRAFQCDGRVSRHRRIPNAQNKGNPGSRIVGRGRLTAVYKVNGGGLLKSIDVPATSSMEPIFWDRALDITRLPDFHR